MLLWYLCVIVCFWLNWLWSRRKYYALMLKIPCRMGYPFLGISLDMSDRKKDPMDVINDISEKYGPLTYTWLAHYPMFVVTEPDIIRDILTSPNCTNKSVVYKPFEKGIGVGILTSPDPEWSAHRKILNPTFGHKILLSFIPIFNREVNKLLKVFDEMAECHDDKKVLQDYALNTALRTTMGIEENEGSKFLQIKTNFQIIISSITEMVFSPWLAIDWVRKILGMYEPLNTVQKQNYGIIREIIGKKLSESNNASKRDSGHKNIFLDQVVELLRKDIFTMKNVEDESNTIIAGAIETTANTIGFALILLAMFPEYQQKAYEELLAMFPEAGEFEVTYADIQDMVYIDLILNESMRIISPIPLLARQNTQDIRLSNGMILPAGMEIVINMFALHRRKDIWGPDAAKFNPDNFLSSNMEGKHPYAFIPFTKGIRTCIGQKYGMISSKMALAKLLRNFEFSSDFKYNDLEFRNTLVMGLKRVPVLKITKR